MFGQPAAGEQLRLRIAQARAFIDQGTATGRTDLLRVGARELESAVAQLPAGDPYRAGYLLFIGTAMLQVHQHTSDAGALEEAVRFGQEALRLCPAGDPNRLMYLTVLSAGLSRRFEHSHLPEHARPCVEVYREMLELAPRDFAERAMVLNNLSASLICLAREAESREYAEQAVQVMAELLRLTGDSPQRGVYQRNLSTALYCRYEQRGDPADLAAAIESLREALRLLPRDYSERPAITEALASLVRERESRSAPPPKPPRDPVARAQEALGLINEGMPRNDERTVSRGAELIRAAIEELTSDCPDLGAYCCYLGIALVWRFRAAGDPADLTAAEATIRRAVRLCRPGDPNRVPFLGSLGDVMATRSNLTDTLADIDAAIEVFRQFVAETPPGNQRRPGAVHDLGLLLRNRFRHTGELSDVDESVDLLRQAAGEFPPEAPYPVALHNLASALLLRFDHAGMPHDLDAARETLEAAIRGGGDESVRADLDLVTARMSELDTRRAGERELSRRLEFVSGPADEPVGRPEDIANDSTDIVRYVNRLSDLLGRYEHEGDAGALDELIRLGRTLVAAMPAGERFAALVHAALGAGLMRHYEATGVTQELDEGIEHLRMATANPIPTVGSAIVADSTRANHLNTLAVALVRRFERDGGAGDLRDAEHAARESVEASKPDSIDRQRNLGTLGTVYMQRFQHAGDRGDLDRAVEIGRQATATDDPALRMMAIGNLGNRLRTRFELTGGRADINEAIRLLRVALDQSGGSSLERFNLALALFDRGDLAESTQQFRLVLDQEGVSSRHRTTTLLALVRTLPDDDPEIDGLLAEAAGSTMSPPQARMDAAAQRAQRLAMRADWPAATGAFGDAVALLPLVAWRGLARSDAERLLSRWPLVANDAAACAIAAGRPERAVELLDHGRSVLWGQALDTRTDLTALRAAHPELADRLDAVRGRLDEDGDQQRNLAREWDTGVAEVRKLPGFEHFLLPTPFARLTEGAADGPVVLINVSEFRCDALVVTTGGVRLVPLPGLTEADARRRAQNYLNTVERLSAVDGPPGVLRQSILDTLEWLWDTVAAPILTHVGEGRVWWCPTGPLALLPLHAAGNYDEGLSVPDHAVSSYATTLRSLIRARRDKRAGDSRLLVLACASRPSYERSLPPLPAAQREAEALAGRFPDSTVITDATRAQAVRSLAEHAYAHIACHGGQNLADPSQGALYLSDGPLRVDDLARLDLERAELAVLTACRTAVGGTALPDESIHLAAALQLAGFRHVVSTLWSVDDETAYEVTEELYRRLTGGNGAIEASQVPEALSAVVARLRERHPYQPDRWIPYVHFGP
jgi:tetratricopeptide (TPR) repeat protein